MKSFSAAAILSALAAPASASETNPVAKVLEMLSGLESKIIKEGEGDQKAYDEFAEWCEENSKNLDFDIKTGKAQSDDLKATIAEQASLISALTSKLEQLSADIATDDADLKSATEIRAKEAKDFSAEEKELSEIIDTLGRAIGILEREMKKGGASMMQLKSAGSLAQALETMVHASMFSAADANRLTALVQSSGSDSESDEEEAVGAPAGAVYEGHSGGILDTLGDLMEKAQSQLEEARAKETTALHNFQMLKQSLEDEIKFAKKEMADANKGLAEASEKKSVAEGDLAVTTKTLAEDTKTLSGLHENCMTKAQDFEASTKSRGEELKALAEAKKIISETTSGAASQSYSLLQTSRTQLSSAADLAKFEAIRVVRDLAAKDHSKALAQLASRMSSAMRLSSENGADPFAKVKGLISDMLDRLLSEAEADATQQAYCEREMAYSNEKKDEATSDIAKLTTKLDSMTARKNTLKEEVAALQKALAELAKSQAEMDALRQEEHSLYSVYRPEMETGLEGIKAALKVLRDYYAKDDKAHAAAEGAGEGIVSLLEVCESDFSKGLAEMISTEDSSAAAYDAQSKENEIENASKEKDVDYKSKEATGLEKAIAEASSDRASVQAELDAVVEYLKKLDDMCIAKPDTYAERKRRHESEIAGLKEALEILNGEAVLLQRGKRNLRAVPIQRH